MSTVVHKSSFYLPLFFGTLSREWIRLVEWVMEWTAMTTGAPTVLINDFHLCDDAEG